MPRKEIVDQEKNARHRRNGSGLMPRKKVTVRLKKAPAADVAAAGQCHGRNRFEWKKEVHRRRYGGRPKPRKKVLCRETAGYRRSADESAIRQVDPIRGKRTRCRLTDSGKIPIEEKVGNERLVIESLGRMARHTSPILALPAKEIALTSRRPGKGGPVSDTPRPIARFQASPDVDSATRL